MKEDKRARALRIAVRWRDVINKTTLTEDEAIERVAFPVFDDRLTIFFYGCRCISRDLCVHVHVEDHCHLSILGCNICPWRSVDVLLCGLDHSTLDRLGTEKPQDLPCGFSSYPYGIKGREQWTLRCVGDSNLRRGLV